jgi:outer membrane protein assembly factor BamB
MVSAADDAGLVIRLIEAQVAFQSWWIVEDACYPRTLFQKALIQSGTYTTCAYLIKKGEVYQMTHKAINLVTMTLCFLIALTLVPAYSTRASLQATKTPINTQNQSQQKEDPVNITFRLLAIEAYYDASSMSDGTPLFASSNASDQPMKSAQYLINTLLSYNNWQNSSVTYNGYRYITHIHLLSADPNARTNFPSYWVGTPTKGNVTYQITHFLANTSAGESNNNTIRILYYCGHSNTETWLGTYPYASGSVPGAPWLKTGSFYLELGKCGSNSSNPNDPFNPTDYQELYGNQLNQTLNTGDLRTNNCTLIILDSCHSGAAISDLQRPGRVIMTACGNGANDYANGWLVAPKANTTDHWSWFTGQNKTNSYFNSTAQTSWPGGVGIIGAIKSQADADGNGWATADEIFGCNTYTPANSTANYTTFTYTMLIEENNSPYYPSGPPIQPARNQTPQISNGVLGGFIPIVQYNASAAFPYNGAPTNSTGVSGNTPPQTPQASQANPGDTWPTFHYSGGHIGVTGSDGPGAGNVLWQKTGFDTNASVIISDWETIVATKNGVVYGLDLTTGSQIWKFTTESQIIATPAWDKDVIYVATLGGGGGAGGAGGAGGILRAINEPTGRVLWNWTAPSGVGFYASPVVADGRVLVATYSQNPSAPCGIYAFNQTTGSPLWGRTLDSPIKSSPAVEDGRVCVATTAASGTQPATLYALAESSGAILWSYSFGSSNVISSPAVGAGLVVIGCMGGGGGGGAGAGLYAFPESGSTPRWEYPTTSPVSSSPAVDEKRGIIVGCSEGPGSSGAVFALTMTGTPIWVSPLSPPESVKMSSPAISGNGLVYVGTMDGKVLCLNETNMGAIIWSYTTASPVWSSPAVSEGHLLVGTSGSNIYSFGPIYPDVAVTNVAPSKTRLTVGDTLTVTVTVANRGDLAQTFAVTLYLGTPWAARAIETIQVTLAGKSSMNITFGFGFYPGSYAFGAYASPVKYEKNTLNNYCSGSSTVAIGPIARFRPWCRARPVPV